MIGKGFGQSHDGEIPVPDPRRPVPKAGETWYVAPNPDSKTLMKVHVIDVTPRTAYLQGVQESGARVYGDRKRWLRSAISFVERVEPPEPTRTGGFGGTATGRSPWYDRPVFNFNGWPVAGEDLRGGDPLVYGDDGKLYGVGSKRIGNDPLFPVSYGDRVVYYDKNGVPRKETW